MQHNTIRFDDGSAQPAQITLAATGTMWPEQVVVDGEVWVKTKKVEQTAQGAIRDYVWLRTERAAQ